jgi:hypothetical protein
MKRGITALIGLLLAVGLVVTIIAGDMAPEPVYTIAQVRAGLAHDPAAWVGRSVLVRARVMGAIWLRGAFSEGAPLSDYVVTKGRLPPPRCITTSTGCPSPLAGLVPPGASPALGANPDLHLQLKPAWPHMSPVLWVRPQSPAPWIRPLPPAPWLAFLRRLPLLQRVLPGPQRGHWGVYTVYRIQILPPHRSRCAPTPCDDALLLDLGAVR